MPSHVHRLFFALRPDDVVREQIVRTAAELKDAQQIRGRWLDPAKLHMTVQFLGDFINADEVVPRAIRAATSLHVAPFEFALDRAASFSRHSNSPCVLCCAPESEAPLQELARELRTLLSAAGLGEYLEMRPYVPHLTIAYARSAIAEPIPIAPIVWLPRAIALIDSHDGPHAQIGTWPLRA